MELVREMRVSTIAALHNLNLAAYFCDKVVVLDRGKVVSHGVPEKALTEQLIKDVYGVRAVVTVHPDTGKPSITFIPSSSAVAFLRMQ